MNFLTSEKTQAIRAEFGTPVYVYDQARLEAAAREVLAFPNAYGLTARFAMKALPTAAIIRVLSDTGLHIDASSGFEVERALLAGVEPNRIQLTAQELPRDLKGLVERGVLFNACSLAQLEAFGQLFPGREVSVRINPGLGSGHSNRTNVGGPSSSFGIWHESLDEVLGVAESTGLRLTRMHTHIGSGGDPEIWKRCARLSLEIAARLPEVTTLNLGGGFKVARMPGEDGCDLAEIGNVLRADFEEFARRYGRELKLEIEPGTYLVANAGVILANVTDVVDTGREGRLFAKIDSGMTEVLRPALYGAEHPIAIVPGHAGDERDEVDVIVVGHCCESSDILTPAPGDPEGLGPRLLPRPVVGDSLLIGGAGAYCSALASKNYNSFPEAPELLITNSGEVRLIRRRQSLEQMIANELLDPAE
jgi:diaminopimelate decarboxylase